MLDRITQNWLLSDLMPAETEALGKSAQKVSLTSGSPLIEQGRTNDSLWIVLKGKLGIQHDGKIVAQLGENELVGEMSWLDGHPASARVVAIENTEAIRIRFTDLDKFLWNHPDAHIQMLRKFAINLSHRLRG